MAYQTQYPQSRRVVFGHQNLTRLFLHPATACERYPHPVKRSPPGVVVSFLYPPPCHGKLVPERMGRSTLVFPRHSQTMLPLHQRDGQNTYQSPDYDSAANTVEITVNSGAGNVSVNTK
jgi:hypothetical protein